MTTRLRGGFGRDEVATAALRWINNELPNYVNFGTILLEDENVLSVRVINGDFAVQTSCPLYPRKRTFAVH